MLGASSRSLPRETVKKLPEEDRLEPSDLAVSLIAASMFRVAAYCLELLGSTLEKLECRRAAVSASLEAGLSVLGACSAENAER